MKKINLIISVVLLLGVIVSAGILSNWNKQINLSPEQIAQIKESGKVTNLNVTISPITCNDEICWAWARQEGVINSKWITQKSYCVKWGENCWKKNITYEEPDQERILICEEFCLEYTEYTAEELQTLVNNYVEGRLKIWADAEINRTALRQTEEQKTGIGIITAK